jgi:hypothetical protein
MRRAEEQPERETMKESIGDDTYVSEMATQYSGTLVSCGEAA